MVWSSNSSTGYAVGQAISDNGKVTGPWRHLSTQLNNDNGGHGMVFRDFDGRLMLSYHTTERGTAVEHMCIRELTLDGGAFKTLDMTRGYRVRGDQANPSFDKATLESATVFIPRDRYMDYRFGDLWSNFSHLMLETDGMDDVVARDSIPYGVVGNTVYLLDKDGLVDILTPDGRLLVSLGNTRSEVSLPDRGIYILRTSGGTRKVII